jgi:hypothetical protein
MEETTEDFGDEDCSKICIISLDGECGACGYGLSILPDLTEPHWMLHYLDLVV